MNGLIQGVKVRTVDRSIVFILWDAMRFTIFMFFIQSGEIKYDFKALAGQYFIPIFSVKRHLQ